MTTREKLNLVFQGCRQTIADNPGKRFVVLFLVYAAVTEIESQHPDSPAISLNQVFAVVSAIAHNKSVLPWEEDPQADSLAGLDPLFLAPSIPYRIVGGLL